MMPGIIDERWHKYYTCQTFGDRRNNPSNADWRSICPDASFC